MKALPLVFLLLTSCMYATGDKVATLGGKVSYNGRNFSVVSDHDDSFRAGAATVGIIAGVVGAGWSDSIAAGVTNTASNNATKQAVNANNNATSLAKEGLKAGVESEAINKGAPLLPR